MIAAIIAHTIVGSYKEQMTNVVTPGQANEYVVRSSFKVHAQSDKFLYSNIQKIPRDTNRGHGGGGGPHGGGPRGGPRGGGRR